MQYLLLATVFGLLLVALWQNAQLRRLQGDLRTILRDYSCFREVHYWQRASEYAEYPDPKISALAPRLRELAQREIEHRKALNL